MSNLIDEYGTLTDWFNTGIDDLSIKFGLKKGDIKTNGQVKNQKMLKGVNVQIH